MSFVHEFKAGSLTPDLQSEITPQAPSHFDLGIVAFNVESFQAMLAGEIYADSDVFVFFNSPVCFNCGDFYPIFEEVASDLSGLLTFGYVDLGKNELQEIAKVYSHPTVRLYKKGSRDYV